ncbi:GPI mannosyltransferase 1, putative [Eimeria tenella]|uniref:GPI mannosyltransferase 1 n=1 Tax=Eimeria tenella TaxID=5802 RepID=U6KM55_EIMTE|nr:GPI mannosyltransferase 1, putative [Eimeria tenella]CDJ37342.1 GPI mannosyltransferase 1, putative [Eimeria tenella]|eukprot:XP_013228180.1 GPI mannosyltransferase 1, putative [Eimeria tenella]
MPTVSRPEHTLPEQYLVLVFQALRLRVVTAALRSVDVKFTDVDYKVYTDAAAHVLKGGSPYERHTYRYSPLVAYLCLPNLLGCPFFGKLLFCCIDLAIALLIEKGLWRIHEECRHSRQEEGGSTRGRRHNAISVAENMSSNISKSSSSSGEYPVHTFLLPWCCWLIHPVVATVSARGNADSIPCLFVLLTVDAVRSQRLLLSAVLYCLAVHVKLYPVIYGVPILLYMQEGEIPVYLTFLPHRPKGFLRQLFWGLVSAPVAALLLPFRACCFLLRNMGRRQWAFGLLSVFSCFAIGSLFYHLYGFPFVFESYLYHATRSDHRHNLSLFFYLLYLDSLAPLKTVTFVALNKVCTTQASCTAFTKLFGVEVLRFLPYFLWWLCLLPFAVAATDLKKKTITQAFVAMAIFQLACLLWLFFGYQLEFEGKPVFLKLMFASAIFTLSQLGLVVFFVLKIRSNDAGQKAKGSCVDVAGAAQVAALERKQV